MPYITPSEIGHKYKEIKELGRLIRSQRFNVKGQHTNLDFRITYIKPHNQWSNEIEINVKVSGEMEQYGWRAGKRSKDITSSWYSSRYRNDEIRRNIRDEVRGFFKLLGVDGWRIEIKKIAVTDKI